MTVQGAVIREQGVTFAVAIVKKHVLDTPSLRHRAHRHLTRLFKVPTVLMAQDASGHPSYWGRDDLSRFMASVPLDAVQWREYRVKEVG
jgi:hypothetical protein